MSPWVCRRVEYISWYRILWKIDRIIATYMAWLGFKIALRIKFVDKFIYAYLNVIYGHITAVTQRNMEMFKYQRVYTFDCSYYDTNYKIANAFHRISIFFININANVMNSIETSVELQTAEDMFLSVKSNVL